MAKRKIKRKRQSSKTLALWLALMGIFIAELLFYTWCRVQCVQVRYEITAATRQRQHLIALHDNLKIELADLKSPQRIAIIAREQLGLITPTPKQMILIP
jgi:cell division protein FtsL